jgi:hypothetical protein
MRENAFVIAMLPAVIVPPIWRAPWVQMVEMVTLHPVLA